MPQRGSNRLMPAQMLDCRSLALGMEKTSIRSVRLAEKGRGVLN
jgi:hypothetical protein